MKSSVRIKLTFVLLLTIGVIVGLGIFAKNLASSKTFAYENGIYNVQAFVDENDDPTSAYFILENISMLDMDTMEDNTVKITSSTASLSFFDPISNGAITATNNIVEPSKNGIGIKVDGLAKGEKYEIAIEPENVKKGYTLGFKKAIIELDNTGVLSASIKSIVDEDDNYINVNENDNMVFLFTEDNNNVKMRAKEDVDIVYTYSLTELSDDQLKNVDWVTYDKNTYLTLSTNGFLYAKAKYKSLTYSEVSVLRISNIDKLDPIIDVTGSSLSSDEKSVNLTFVLKDAEATNEYGKSQVKSYAFTTVSTPSEADFTTVSENSTINKTITDNGDYYITLKDNAGNSKQVTIQVTNISELPDNYSLIILNSPVASLNGSLYRTFDELTNALHANGLDKDDEVLVQVVNDISGQSGTFNDINVVLDLNGHTIQTNKHDSVFNVQSDGKLKIDDFKYNIGDYVSASSWNGQPYSEFSSGDGNGTIIGSKNNAVNIESGGEFIVGTDNTIDIAHVEVPDQHTPSIDGKNKGVYNRGTFKFFDGVITAPLPVDDAIDETPYIYDPSIVLTEDQTKQQLTLAKVTGIEALIGRTRFTYLEDAIEAANTRYGLNGEQVKIDLIADITRSQTIVFDDTKNIHLELNGHSLNSTTSTLTNYGRLVITSAAEGSLITSSAHDIINKAGAYLSINGVKISNSTKNYFPIYQEVGAELVIEGGEYYQTKSGCNVYNEGGKVTVNGGKMGGSYYSSDYPYNSPPAYGGNSIYSITAASTEVDEVLDNDFMDDLYYGYFVKDDNGVYQPQSYNRYAGYEDYVVFDLSDKPEYEYYRISYDVEGRNVPSGSSIYGGYTVLKTTNSAPNRSQTGAFGKVTGTVEKTTVTKSFQGGKTYYLYLGYDRRNVNTAGTNEYYGISNARFERVKTANPVTVVNGGTLSGASYVIYNNSANDDAVTLNGGLVTGAAGCVYIQYGTATVNNLEPNSRALYAQKGGKIVVNGGTFGGVQIWNGSAIINDGTLGTVTSTNTLVADEIDITINGGTITNVYNYGHMTIKDATIDYLKHDSPYDLTVNNVTFTKNIDIAATATGNVTINKASLSYTRDNGQYDYFAIQKNGNLDLTINNMDIEIAGTTQTSSSNVWKIVGLYNTGAGTITLDNFKVNNTHRVSNKETTYAIYNAAENTIILGNPDGEYHENTVDLYGGTNGIFSTRTQVKFYDGIIKSTGSAIAEEINTIEDGYVIDRNTVDGIDTVKLKVLEFPNILNVEKNKTYATLISALGEVGSGETLRFLNDDNYEYNSEAYTFDENKNVIIDVHGKNVYINYELVNNGTVKFTDSADTHGSVSSKSITNNSNLTLENVGWTMEVTQAQGVMNYGTININNVQGTMSDVTVETPYFDNRGTITIDGENTTYSVRNNNYDRIFRNRATGNLIINNGTFTNNVIRNSFGNVTINGGTLNGSSYIGAFTSTASNPTYTMVCTVSSSCVKPTISKGTIYNTQNKQSYFYIPIDVTEYSGDVTVKVKYTAGNDSYDTRLAVDKNTSSTPSWDYNKKAIVKDGLFTKTIQGGSKYYLKVWSYNIIIYSVEISDGTNTDQLFKQGLVTVNDGTINGIIVLNNSNAIINKAAVNGSVSVNPGSTLVSKDVTYTKAPITADKDSVVDIDGSKFSGQSNAINATQSHLYVKNATFTYSYSTAYNITNVIKLSSGATLDMRNTTATHYNSMSRPSDGTFISIIYDNGAESIYIKDSTLTSTSYWAPNTPLYISGSPNVVINNSTLTGGENRIGSESYGIYMIGDANVTISNEDGDENGYVSTTMPKISGITNGIYRTNGTLNYYDGEVIGRTSFVGGVNDMPEGYQINIDMVSNTEHATLVSVPIVKNTNTGVEYSKLQQAFNECPNNTDCYLEVIHDISTVREAVIPDDKIINFNIAGHTINVAQDKNFKNFGIFKVSGGTMVSAAVSNGSAQIDNYNILEINTGTIMTVGESYDAKCIITYKTGKTYINAGTFNATTVKGSSPRAKGRIIQNRGGYVEVNDGTFNVKDSSAIHGIPDFPEVVNLTPDVMSISYDEYIGFETLSGSDKGKIYVPLDLTSYVGTVNVKFTVGCNSNTSNTYSIFRENDDGTTTLIGSTYGFSNKITANKDLEGGYKYRIQFFGPGYIYFYDLVIAGESQITQSNTVINNMTMNTDSDYAIGIRIANSKLTVNNGTFNGKRASYEKAIEAVYNSDVYIKDATFIKPLHAVDTSTTKLKVDKALVKYSEYGIYATYGTTDIKDFTFISYNDGVSTSNYISNRPIYLHGVTTATITSPNIKFKGGGYAIFASNDCGQVDIINPTIDVEATGNNYDAIGIMISGDNTVANVEGASILATGGRGIGITLSKGTLNVGKNDNTVDTSTIAIEAGSIGVNNTGGIFNLYDGIVKAPTPDFGGVNNVPTNYVAIRDEIDYIPVLKLTNEGTIKNTQTGQNYLTIQAAVDACDNNECLLESLYSYNYLTYVSTIPSNKNIILDLKSNTFVVSAEHGIVNNGTLKVKNGLLKAENLSTQTRVLDNYGNLTTSTLNIDVGKIKTANVFYNNIDANLIIDSGSYTANYSTTSTSDSIVNGLMLYNLGGNVTINGGDFYVSSSRVLPFISSARPMGRYYNNTYYEPGYNVGSYAFGGIGSILEVDLTEYGNTNVNVKVNYQVYNVNSTYPSTSLYILNENRAYTSSDTPVFTKSEITRPEVYETTLTGGRKYYFTSSGYFMYNDILVNGKSLFHVPDFIINGGIIHDPAVSANTNNSSKTISTFNSNVVLNGGKIEHGTSATNSYGISINSGTFTLNDFTIENVRYPIALSSYCTAKFNGGNILNTVDGTFTGLNINTCYVDINDINIESTKSSSNDIRGIYNASSYPVIMRGGTVHVDGSKAYGIYNGYSTFEYGVDDGIVLKNKPAVYGGYYGIYSSAVYKYSDGTFESASTPMGGKLGTPPQDYMIYTYNKKTTLEIDSTVENTYEYNGGYYQDIKIPITSIGLLDNKVGTITLGNDVLIEESITIPADINLTIALNGHSISFSNTEYGFINNGTLTIIDGSFDQIDLNTTSAVLNEGGTVIQNNGTLTIGAQNNPNPNSPIIYGNVGVSGNNATVKSGSVKSSSQGDLLSSIGYALNHLFTPTYSYVNNQLQVNKVPDTVALATKPNMRATSDLSQWTNESVVVGLTSHNYGILNLFTKVDQNQKKKLKYTVEIYKNDVLDEFNSFDKEIEVQYLADNKIEVDHEYFDGIKDQFKDYYVTKLVINGEETNTVPLEVPDGTVFQVYYGQTKGEEIEVVVDNPKTGKNNNNKYYVIALVIAAIMCVIILVTKRKNKESM
ncbi:MAG: hypothetical protein K5666_02445 [Bacilli bacterium]|nr:hypothetical protein [Bacilli bacterium]